MYPRTNRYSFVLNHATNNNIFFTYTVSIHLIQLSEYGLCTHLPNDFLSYCKLMSCFRCPPFMAKQPNFKSHDYNYSYCVWSTHWLGVVWCHFMVLRKEVTDLNFYRVVVGKEEVGDPLGVNCFGDGCVR